MRRLKRRLQNYPNRLFGLVNVLKTYSKVVEGVSNGKLCFSEKERGEVFEDYMERIIGIVMWKEMQSKVQ